MHFVFSPPASAAAGLLDLPWDQPLEEWTDDRLTEVPQRGLSRHVVRFVAEDDAVVERPDDLDSVLVTRFLDYSSSFRALFANPRGGHMADRLLDAMVELLAR